MDKIKARKKQRIKYIGIIAIGIILFLVWQNNHIVQSDFSYRKKDLPKAFNNFKILHISDLHNKSFGKDQSYLLKKIEAAKADIIVITGDLIDRRRYDLDTALTFIKGAKELAPIYYVSGNHEAWSGDYDNIREHLINQGVFVLDDKKMQVKKDGEAIEILGIKDPAFYSSSYFEPNGLGQINEKLGILNDSDSFKILLSHRPELIETYSRHKLDIIFSGHAHGGQFRMPGLGGLVAPDQGLFPKYTSGAHRLGESTLYISRGLGNSIIPIRIFNRPQIIVLTLFNE